MATVQELEEVRDGVGVLVELQREEDEVKDEIEQTLGVQFGKFHSNGQVLSEFDEISKISDSYKINATEARNMLNTFPKEYIVQEQTVPELIKSMRNKRRELKGANREKMAKAIDTMISAYSDHLNKCVDSIHWLSPYKSTFLKMRFNEKDLRKLNKMKDLESRREVVDALCKYWEAEIEQEGMVYGKDYANLSKAMKAAKRDFRATISKVSDQSITKTKKQKQQEFVLKTVCENQGIGARQIHERMPTAMYRSTSANMISKMVKKLDIVSLDGAYYKISGEIKKNIWAYTAAFIDSDGYITLDRNMNPRVGLVATGERGKAFMMEMHKSIGFGRMHLDQKSPQDTRLINRLNFYSQADVGQLLTKCLPHFRLKKGNAKLLLELIRMKKSYKKAEWYKPRCDEIFKLMKWENHKDHVGFNWDKENINLDDIQKYTDNCKMSVMDEMETVGGIIAKSGEFQQYRREIKEAMNKKIIPTEDEQTIISLLDLMETQLQNEKDGNVGLLSPANVKSRLDPLLNKYGIGDRERFERKHAME
jgi:hypothetical protein